MINAGLFFSSIAAKSVFKKGKHTSYLVAIAALVFILSFALKDIDAVYRIKELNFLYLGTVYMIILPATLLILAKIRRVNYGKDS
jgi:tellurite resistance protein TehA-like permease